ELRHQDRAIERRDDELGGRGRYATRGDLVTGPPFRERLGEPGSPEREDLRQPRAEPLMDVGELRGEVAHRAAPHAIAVPLRLEEPVEEAADLRQPVGVGIREAWIER